MLGARVALRELERAVAEALGPGTEVAAIRADLSSVVVEGLVIPGGEGWPARESFRTERVRVVPEWRSFLGTDIRIARIEVKAPYASMLRTRDGRLRLLPSLLDAKGEPTPAEAPAADAGANEPGRSVSIAEVHVEGGTVEIYDATIARTPWRIQLTALDARIEHVVAPSLAERMPFEVRAVLEGPQHGGRVEVAGWLVAGTRDLEIRAALDGIDLLALEPYLVEATKARLARGTLDLTVDAMVADRQLHAPGHLTLSHLEFARGGRPTTRVLGVPRDLLVTALQAKGGRIALEFSLDGRVDDPRFSLNETFSTRVAVALAKELGLGVGGLVEGTLGLGLEGLEGAGKAAGGVGSALRRLAPRR